MKLDSDLSFGKRFKATAIFFIVCSLLYGLTNRYQFFSEFVITSSVLDKKIPYIPWTVLLYVSLYPFVFVAFLSIKKQTTFYRMLFSYYLLSIISFLFFLFCPTQFVWDHSLYNDFFTRYIFAPVKTLDQAFNSFPSEHVSLAMTAPIFLLAYGYHLKGCFLFFWGALISLSIVTVKQHYFIDIPGGLVVALLAVLLTDVCFQYKPFKNFKFWRYFDRTDQ